MRVMGECAYPAPMNRPLRITALVLLPLTMAGAVLTGCSRSESPAADASASAEPSDAPETSTGTPDPAAVPTVATTAPPSPTATESAPATDSADGDDSGDSAPGELPAQGLDQAAALDNGLNVQIGALRAADIAAAPGEIGGAGIIVPVTVGNSTGQDISLSGLVVTVTYGADAVPADAVEGASDVVPASLAPGQGIVVEYGFVVPVEERGSVSVVVDSGAESRLNRLRGRASTS